MTKIGILHTSGNEKTILLYTGNIMTNGDRGGFFPTSMSKNNVEVAFLYTLKY